MATISIERTPDVCGGEARLAGRRIAVWMLVEAKRLGLDDEEIAARFDPPLASHELTAAWEYARDHGLEIERALWLNEACMVEQDDGVPVEMLVEGRRLGFTDEAILEAFEPPLMRERFESIWRDEAKVGSALETDGNRG